MIPLDDLIHATSAEVLQAGARIIFEGFAHDSRAVAPGDCFVAVHGMHGDGHDFASRADPSDTAVRSIRNVQVSGTIHGDPLRETESGGGAVSVSRTSEGR